MVSVRARVLNGRLIVNAPTDLPEGAEVELVAVIEHAEDHLDDDSRRALHAALADAAAAMDADRLVDGDEVLARLANRRR